MARIMKIEIFVEEDKIAETLQGLANEIGNRTFPEEYTSEHYKATISFKRVNWTPEKDELLLATYHKGEYSKSQLAKMFFCSKETIASRLKTLGIQMPFSGKNYKEKAKSQFPDQYIPGRQGLRWTDEELSTVKRSFEEGKTVEEIAIETDRSIKAIQYKLQQLGLIEEEN